MLNRRKIRDRNFSIFSRVILGCFAVGILSSCETDGGRPTVVGSIPTDSTIVSAGEGNFQNGEKINLDAIKAVFKDISAKCNSEIVIKDSNSTVNCGNVTLIIYPPVPGPSKTTIVPVVSFLSRNYKWKLESTTQLEGTSRGLEILSSQLSSPGLQTLMSQSSYLIAIGTASHEGDLDEEDRRAKLRSIAIDDVLRRTLPAKNVLKEFYLLNLGKYDSKCVETKTKSTSYQRPVLIMNILIQSEGKILPSSALVRGLDVNTIEKAIRDKVSDEPPADVNLKCYPLFKLTP